MKNSMAAKQKMVFILLAFALMLFSMTAQARPLSYPDGFMTMIDVNGSLIEWDVIYTLTPHFGFGYEGEWDDDKDYQAHGLKFNHLLKRWNNPASQANLYASYGGGLVRSLEEHKDGSHAQASLAADWEDRQFLIAHEMKYHYFSNIADSHFEQKFRTGFAPYIGDAGDLHTWIFLDMTHQPMEKENVIYGPSVRFFQGTHLIEFGVKSNDTFKFNYTHQF
jgi:hypothetical protein